MGRALIVSAGASSNEYLAARLSELGYSRPVIIPSPMSSGTSCASQPWSRPMPAWSFL